MIFSENSELHSYVLFYSRVSQEATAALGGGPNAERCLSKHERAGEVNVSAGQMKSLDCEKTSRGGRERLKGAREVRRDELYRLARTASLTAVAGFGALNSQTLF